jgi:hypothetical protein
VRVVRGVGGQSEEGSVLEVWDGKVDGAATKVMRPTPVEHFRRSWSPKGNSMKGGSFQVCPADDTCPGTVRLEVVGDGCSSTEGVHKEV